MPAYVVYVDQVFIGSLVMNMMILWATARLGKIAYKRWRLVAGGAVGALYSLFLFIPALEGYLGPGYKLMVSLLMVAVVFLPSPPKKVLVLLAYFYISTFALGGTVLGIITFLQKNTFDGRLAGIMQAVDAFLWYGVLLALVIYWILGRVMPVALRKRLTLPLLRADLTVSLAGRKVTLSALWDTGNSLSDPLTGFPVIIAEYAAIKDILPEKVCLAVESCGRDDGAAVLAALGENIRPGNFRIIPYRSVGRENGWLLGFRPDEVELKYGGNIIKVSDVVVALYQDGLQDDTSCRALLPTGLF
ncbi:sigma-E processing peptidase SpoIIGA [Desulfallas thermosapovorans]|uniref:Sporulation sigma-E factor-processing peptidase n=1 Tax=Desulfallas thermosapovorans DSM 6562 TaxID=1121431 RepID=A0A5S4ZUK0_9FIRM|nr:sigma-E processing peptidase SpoIIGA [Desulfallas thermosapovorans]TYO95895.1 stage II sporulation protein GA (sporulation sigma-E factor processing peptidase) [Desulfallas thermosapovorans DSM 6562]